MISHRGSHSWQQRFSFHRSLTYSLIRTLTYTMAGIPIPRGYNTGSGGPTNNHSRRLGGTTTTISSSGGAGVGGSIVDVSTPTHRHNMEQSLVQQPKVEPRRHRPAPPSYRPTTQLQQQPEPPPQQHMPYGVSTSSLPVTPRSEEKPSSWSSGPQHHEWNISSNNNISNFKSNSNDNEGMGTKSCLTFSKQGLGNHTNKHTTTTTRFGRGGTTTSTTTSNHSSVASSSANSSGRRSMARSFLSLRRGSSGIISATASNNSSRRGAASSQSSQASSNNNNYNKNAAAWSISQPQQPPLTTNYVSDDEYFSENAESWLLKETSNYTPWSVGSAYGEKPTTTTMTTTDSKTAIVSPETTIRDTTTASTTSLPSVEHFHRWKIVATANASNMNSDCGTVPPTTPRHPIHVAGDCTRESWNRKASAVKRPEWSRRRQHPQQPHNSSYRRYHQRTRTFKSSSQSPYQRREKA